MNPIPRKRKNQRAVIESVDVNGRPFRSVVKWANLASLNDQLF
jgi:hypothetical protein